MQKNSLIQCTLGCGWELAANRILLIHMHLRLMHFPYSVIFKSLLGPWLLVVLEQFQQRQETTSLATWTDEGFTQQRYCQNCFLLFFH